MKRVLKWLAIAALVGIGTCAGSVWWLVDRDQQAHRQREAVKFSAALDERCPVTVTVRNESDRTLKRTSFELKFFMPGNSASDDVTHEWSLVVRPGGLRTACFPFPGNREKANPSLIVRAEHRTWDVEFYREGEFVP
jgi:hypothetical protein